MGASRLIRCVRWVTLHSPTNDPQSTINNRKGVSTPYMLERSYENYATASVIVFKMLAVMQTVLLILYCHAGIPDVCYPDLYHLWALYSDMAIQDASRLYCSI